MPALTPQQTNEFLIGGNHILRLATVTTEGWPYAVPVWYDYDGKTFTVLGRPANRWIPYLEREPRVGLLFDTTQEPFVRITASGTAEVVDKNWFGEWEYIATRYVGQKAGHKYYEDTKHIPRVLIKITPGKFTTWTGSDWHPRYLPKG
ncbi:MAG: pyridoxamine 5'-phosphate oxidase family protein [Chloroflexi bacterium]|nr:pyridoxamine 5'-phosphate oxidase family protein [Chloroflexota bacterium]